MYRELEPKDNTFYSIGVDITHRCNMNCPNCYIPNRTIPDLNIDRFETFLSELPNRTEIRLIGAEPTMNRDLPHLISLTRQYKHRPVVITNGLRIANKDYLKTLYDAGLRTINISMNGADDDAVYEKTDFMKCATKKMAALRNATDLNLFININCLLNKGLNDHIPARLIEISQELGIHPVLRFRNIGEVGRYSFEENWTYEGMIDFFSELTGRSVDFIKSHNTINGYTEKNTVLFPLHDSSKNTYIKITNWNNDSLLDFGSNRRGRLTQNFKVAPFFEHVIDNEFGY